MKRLWAAGILFLCAAALCFWQGWHTGRTTDLLEQEVRAAVEASEQGDASLAEAHTLAAIQKWESANREMLPSRKRIRLPPYRNGNRRAARSACIRRTHGSRSWDALSASFPRWPGTEPSIN